MAATESGQGLLESRPPHTSLASLSTNHLPRFTTNSYLRLSGLCWAIIPEITGAAKCRPNRLLISNEFRWTDPKKRKITQESGNYQWHLNLVCEHHLILYLQGAALWPSLICKTCQNKTQIFVAWCKPKPKQKHIHWTNFENLIHKESMLWKHLSYPM